MALEPDDHPLFGSLVVSDSQTPRRLRTLRYSLAAHGLALGVFVLFALFGPTELPELANGGIRVLLYDPPPPPPPPLPKGSPLVKKSETKPTTPDTKAKPDLTVPDEHPKEKELKPENKTPEDKQAGVADGSDMGTPEGMEGGVDGGQVGGVPGGVLGGVLGGTGDIVPDWDRAPQQIRATKPVYPPDAFTKKIEGVVQVEFVIEVDGSVRYARIVHSVPALDGAALAAVRQWTFAPALKAGRPVRTKHIAPVRFSIY